MRARDRFLTEAHFVNPSLIKQNVNNLNDSADKIILLLDSLVYSAKYVKWKDVFTLFALCRHL